MKQVRKVQTWRQVRGPAGAVMLDTLDLGIKWPFLAHPDIRRRQKHRYEKCFPERCEENASAAGQDSLLVEVGSTA